MKRIIFTLSFSLLLIQPLLAIDFFKGSYKEALVNAQQTGKPLLLYFTATWCGPCQYMQQYVFPDATLSAYVAENYLALKLDIDAEEGKFIYKKMHQPKGPTGVPAFIIVKANEEILKKQVGAMKLEQLRAFLLRDNDEKVIYKALSDSLAKADILFERKKPNLWSKFYYHAMVSAWKPGMKLGVSQTSFRSNSETRSTTGYELGFFFNLSFKDTTGNKGFWRAWRYSFQPGLSLTSKGGSTFLNQRESSIDMLYLELELLNIYQIKGTHGFQILAGPYLATAIMGNINEGYGKRGIDFKNEFNHIDYGLKLGGSKDFGSFKAMMGYNLGLKNINHQLTKILNAGVYASFALIVGK